MDPPKSTSNTKELDVPSVASTEATSMKEKLQECLDLDTTNDGKDYYHCTCIDSVYTKKKYSCMNPN